MHCHRPPISLSAADHDAAYRWLLRVCRTWLLGHAGRGSHTLPALASAAPWPAIRTMAHFHGVAPLIHNLAQNYSPDWPDAPRSLREEWERTYYSTRLKNTETLNLLGQILDACRPARIGILVLKGPAAMAEVHRDIGLRPMVDLDLLCRVPDLPALTAIVRSLGFSMVGSPDLHQLALYRVRDGMLVELHFNAHYCVRDKRRFLEGAWRDATEAALEEWRFPVMSPEHQIVFDIAHAVHDGGKVALKHAVDVAGRLMRPGLPLRRDVLSGLLEETGLDDEFPLLVATLETLLDLPLEASIAPRPSAARLTSYARAFVDRSKSIGFAPTSRAGGEFLRQRGAGRKALLVWRKLFPPLAALRAAYGLRSGLPCIPVHAARTLLDFASRRRRRQAAWR